MIEKRSGMKVIKEFFGDEYLVGIIEFDGVPWIASNKAVYRYDGKTDSLEPVQFQIESEI